MFLAYIFYTLFFALCTVSSVLWHCWLGDRKGIWPVKNWAVGCWHGWLVLPFWYRFTRVVRVKGPLKGCVCVFCAVSQWCLLLQTILARHLTLHTQQIRFLARYTLSVTQYPSDLWFCNLYASAHPVVVAARSIMFLGCASVCVWVHRLLVFTEISCDHSQYPFSGHYTGQPSLVRTFI